MGRSLSAAEVGAENTEKMGEALGSQYTELWQELAHLHARWAEYVELFGTKEERVELLNKAARVFFRVVQDDLWEATLLHIARLTDPPRSMGRKDRENLTIQNLPKLIEDATLKAEVLNLIDIARRETEFCRDWRNRHIAHRDLDLALKRPATPLATGSRLKVKVALNAIINVMHAIEIHYKESETMYDLMPHHDGAVDLLYVLDDGLRAREERLERLRGGKGRDGDYAVRDL
jgi:hypothetical protein